MCDKEGVSGPPVCRVCDGVDGEDVQVPPPHPGDDGVLPALLHPAVDVGGGPAVGEHRHVPLAPEPRHRPRAQAGGPTGELRQCLVNIGIVISWKILFSLLKFTPDREGKEPVCKKVKYSPFWLAQLTIDTW